MDSEDPSATTVCSAFTASVRETSDDSDKLSEKTTSNGAPR